MNTFTLEQAVKIIESKKVIDATGRYEDISVAHVGYLNAEGQPFTWSESGEPYAIVSLKAMTNYQADLAMEELAEDNIDDAVNHSMTFNAPLDVASKLCKNALVDVVVGIYINKEGVEVLSVTGMTVATAKVAKKLSVMERLAQLKASKNATEQA